MSIEYEDGNYNEEYVSPPSLFVKFSMPDLPFIGDLLRKGKMYNRELMIYETVSSHTHLMPKVYYMRCNEQSDFVIVMEDLK